MGKKSNAKKFNREVPVIQTKKDSKKALKAVKALSKIKEHAKKYVNKQTIFGGTLTLIMLTLLVTVGFLLFNKAFKPQPIAKILPADSVIAVLEINTNFEHSQVIKTMDLLKKYPEYSKATLLKYIETKFEVNYEQDLKPWLGRSIGMAFMNSQKEQGSVYELYFAEINAEQNALKFFGKNKKVIYSGYEVYTIKPAAYVTFIDNYVFISTEEQGIYELIDAVKDGKPSLYHSDKYRRIDDNLPVNKVAFLYLDFEKINNGFIKYFPIISEQNMSIEVLMPFFKIFKAEGFALIALDNNFVIQSFLSLDANKMEDSQFITFKEKYKAKLTDFVATDTLAFWGGKNLEYQMKRIVDVFASGNEEMNSFITALVQNYVQKYFGSDVNFKQDILPLFKNEFALAVEQIEGKNIYKILIEFDNPEDEESILKNIAENFVKSGGVFNPQIVEHTLPDGTLSKEIIAIPAEIQKIDSTYKDVPIHGLKIGKKDWGIYYAVINKIAVIATHIDGVKSTIDIDKGVKNSLQSTALFDYQIAPILENSDEITYFNFKKLFPILTDKNPLNEYLKPIESFSSGKNYFNDGIVTINYLHID